MDSTVHSLEPGPDAAVALPAALAQERLWFLDRLSPGTALYNMPVLLRLSARVSRSVLERCLCELVRRHESLRTTFASGAGHALQVISPPSPPELPLVDLRRHPRRERERRLHQLAEAEIRRPFDLARGPLLRATLFRLAADDHALLLVMHHIVSDARSIEVLVHELSELYAAFDAGRPSPLERLAIQYADWACWQRGRLATGALDEEIELWRARLAGAPTVLELPADRARPEQPSYAGGNETFVVDAELAARLRALGQRHGCTLYMTLLAAYATLLARHAGVNDLLIGSPQTNRDRPELESLIGLFVNTVVVRVDLRDAPTVGRLLERVRAMLLDVYAHAELPLEKLIEALQPERGAGRHPLFQVLFAFQTSLTPGAPDPAVAHAGATQPPTTGTSKFDLSLLMHDAPGALAGTWEYAVDLFEPARIRRLGAHFVRLLRAFADTPEARVSDLPMMDEAEARELGAFEHARAARPGRGACVHERIAAQARRTPDALAVEARGERLTYAGLIARASALSARLRALGVGPDQRVGVFVRRDTNLVVAPLAIHGAGAAFVPLDPAHPRERLAYVAADAQLRFAVTDEELREELPPGVEPVCAAREAGEAAPEAWAAVSVPGESLAYVLYTSGTTGRPKGVAVPHACVAALLDWAGATFEDAELARVLGATSSGFDISVFELFAPLVRGGCVVVVDNVLALAAPGAPDVTLINTVPSAMRELLRLWRPGPALRSVNLAGEALPHDLARLVHERAPGVALHNLYGPTETTVYSTGTRLAPGFSGVPPIGRPIDGTSVYVLDERLARVPLGVPGELHIGGAGVARGYLGRPAGTAERYLPDPFAAVPGARMYRTGDVVCWRPDGLLEYRGRADHQVKLRGHRIELGEIETALRRHPRVGDAVVVLRRGAAGDAQLVAYVTMDAPEADELERAARAELPAYMVPARIVFLDALPRTPSGKLDRAALPAPVETAAAPSRAPANETEAALSRLFAAVLELPSFDVERDFFAAGGHSLLATGLVARANELLGLELPLGALFEHPTPARLAAFVGAGAAPRHVPAPRRRAGGESVLPLAFAQRGMWFYDRLRPRSALYNLPLILPAHGGLELEPLQRSVDYLVARHEALRLCFDMAGGEPVQRVVEDARVKVARHDLSRHAGDELRRRAQRILERETQRPFDLRRAPLLRVALLHLSDSEQLLVFVMHHIVGDGWSTDVLQRDFAAAYRAFTLGGRPAQPALALQYGDYVMWQRELLTAQAAEERLAYFRRHLAGAPALIDLPADHPRPAQPTFRGGVLAFEIDPGAGGALARLAAERGATAHMAYLAVFGALLHQYSGQDDVVIGIPVANRARPEWRDVVGLFTNTIPIRVSCGSDPTFVELLDRVREAAVGAYAYEDLPFDRLVQELSPARDLAHHPLFQVMLGFQELQPREGAPSGDVLAATGTAKFDLSISLSRSGERVSAVLEYATDLFERASMERVVRRYRRLVEALAAEPGRPLDSLAPLEDDERAWCAAGRRVTPPLSPPAPDDTPAATASAAVATAARTDVERRIAQIWAEALGHEQFGVDQSFFEVGGHSLAAVCVIVRIVEEWGVELPFESIFLTPTIEDLARAVEAAPAGGEADGAEQGPELRVVERGAGVALSFAQERLWVLDQMAPGLPVYNISFPIAFADQVDTGALERALERLGERHESLRTRFVAGESGPQQVFDPLMSVDLVVTDLSSRAPAARRAEAERLVRLEARRYFDLAAGPLLRTHLVRLSPREDVLLVTIHHIIADAQSVDILQRDLLALYAAECDGGGDPLPELGVQYADFAVWQRAWLRGERLAEQLAHWRRVLEGAPSVLELPTDRPRPSEQSFAGAQLPLSLGREVSAALRRLAGEEQATPFMALLALFGALLGRWSGAPELVVGTPIIGRPRRELEQLIGFFSNTLPLRLDLSGRPTLRALLRRVRDVVIDGFSHQELPFEAIVQELQPQRSLAHNPLFQVMFAFQRPAAPSEARTPRNVSAGSGTSKFDLTLFMVDEPELHGAVEYATDLFDEATIERFARHLCAAAAAASAAPDAELGDILGASPADLAAIEGWNATAVRVDSGAVLAHELCAAQAARTPAAAAVSAGSTSWTYAGLMRRASRLALRLRHHGVRIDSRVALVAEPSPHLIASVVGVWMAGGACVPLDPRYPAARLAYMAADSGAGWLVRPPGGAALDAGQGVVVLDLEAGDEVAEAECEPLEARGGSPDQLAYLVYTSGSTGRPKGVAMPHGPLLNLVAWQAGLDGRGGARRTLQFASPSFDVFFQEVLLTLATGGELVVADPEARRDPALLVELCRARRVERLFLPFVALRELAETGVGRAPLGELREVITAGEQLQVTPALRRFFAAHPDCRLFNQYGPSETHVVTEHALGADPAAWDALPPIGRAIANDQVHVLDADLRPLPIGVPGDLYLGGVGLARGYLDQPALTAARFVPDPLSAVPGARLYRSGDRARWRAEGCLEFLGRGDDQVKIRGYRVELAEVEAALAALPGVRQAVAAAVPDARGERRLVGYVLSDDPGAGGEALRQALHGMLPEPLVPSAIVVVDALPRTPSGKVDRRALQAPVLEPRTLRQPTNELERLLTGTWCDVLGLDQVGLDDDFFALGGHSLSATRVAARLRERLGADVPVRWIFEHPTVARLAACLAHEAPAPGAGSATAVSEIRPLPRDGQPLPTSFAQERLWFLDRMAPGNPSYNLVTGYDLPSSLSVDALRRSLDELVRRHEALRTVFEEIAGRPVQHVRPAARVNLEVVDLSHLEPGELRAEVQHWADEEGRRAFDLERGPLFRATLLDLGRHGYRLLLAMHHIISDGWSLRVLQRDLLGAYEAFERGGPPAWPALRVHYADFAAWQRESLRGAALDALLDHWRAHLAGAPHRLELPADRPRVPAAALRGATHAFELEAGETRALGALGQQEGATLFMVALALFFELIRRHARQDDFLIGTPIGARPRPELEELVGLFVNTLVLRADLSGDPSMRELLRRVREETLAAYARAELPFERLVEELQPRRDLGMNPLIQIAFGLHHATEGAAQGADTLSGNGSAKFELSLVMTEAGGRLSGVFEYDRDLFEPQTIARLAEHFRLLARHALEAPEAPLSRCVLLREAEARDVLGAWAAGPPAPGIDVLECVARHAREASGRVAVEAPDGAWSYAELEAESARLAGRLRALGVERETTVGLCLGNSRHLPLALLAIWRAGGVYLPLDPALPAARLLHLIVDARARVLITDAAGAERLSGCAARVVLAGEDGVSAHDETGGVPPLEPEQLAYVVYTSGSTGQPKGVMVPHRGLRSLVAAQVQALGLKPGERVLKLATPSFDASVFEMTGALAAGATLCLEPQDELLPRPELVALLRRRAISMLTITPSSLAMLPVEPLPELRLLFVAGEACPAELVAHWSAGRRMLNGYGPTETSVWASYAECRGDGRRPPIGKPVANATVHVVDRHGQPVAVGIPGELWIGGPVVARGYLGRPELTAAAFMPDPWGAPGARLYRTGDLVRWRPDGALDFLGRCDGQIKLRGVRIEPSEIEAALATQPGVAYCAVVLREDRPGQPRLVAYVVAAPAASLDPGALRRALQGQLPRFMVPARIVVLDALPRTPSGKLDRQALPAPSEDAGEAAPAPPRGALEEAVGRVWAEVLGVRVGRDDNFFELGGHSLLVTRVLSRLRDELGVEIPLRRMFEAPSLTALCEGFELCAPGANPRIPRAVRRPMHEAVSMSVSRRDE